MNDDDLILGIDLGTTNSLGAVMQDGAPRVLRDERGRGIIPSLVACADDGALVVGEAARVIGRADPTRCIFSVKRLMGRSFEEIAGQAAALPYEVTHNASRVVCVRLAGRDYTPQEISAHILTAVRLQAEAALGRPVTRACITVPAYFDDSQRAATRDAGRIAGLEVMRIINEPTAASLAYGLGGKEEGLVAVYDFGGGTFDCSVLKIKGGVFKVLSTAGDTALGGDDLDRALADHLRAMWQEAHPDAAFFRVRVDAACPAVRQCSPRPFDIASIPCAPRSGSAAREGTLRKPPPSRDAKPERTDSEVVRDIEKNFGEALRLAAESAKCALSEHARAELALDGPDGVEWRCEVTRARFEALIAPLVDKTLACVRRALEDAQKSPADFDDVVCVGGSTRIPMVRARLAEFFGRAPHTRMNPEEVVALGAAVQGEVLSGRNRGVLLLDVIPLSLGIETQGGAMTKLIARNAQVPIEAVDEFSTYAENQTKVLLHVLQGERELARDCRSLGRFVLEGVPPMPAGLPRIKVTFRVDASGLLTVTAHEIRSDTRLEVRVQPSHSLTKPEVDALVRESIEKVGEDFLARKLLELRNKAGIDLGAAKKQMPVARKLWPRDKLRALRDAMTQLEQALERDDLVDLDNAWQRFSELTVPLAEAIVNYHLSQATYGKTVDELSP